MMEKHRDGEEHSMEVELSHLDSDLIRLGELMFTRAKLNISIGRGRRALKENVHNLDMQIKVIEKEQVCILEQTVMVQGYIDQIEQKMMNQDYNNMCPVCRYCGLGDFSIMRTLQEMAETSTSRKKALQLELETLDETISAITKERLMPGASHFKQMRRGDGGFKRITESYSSPKGMSFRLLLHPQVISGSA